MRSVTDVMGDKAWLEVSVVSCWMGLKSGLCAGLSSSSSVDFMAGGALSCWTGDGLPQTVATKLKANYVAKISLCAEALALFQPEP